MDVGHLNVGLYVTVNIGDAVAIHVDAHGCEDGSCICPGLRYQVILNQADGQGCMVVAPVRTWAALAALMMKTLATEHPELMSEVLDHADTHVHLAPEVAPPFRPRMFDAASIMMGTAGATTPDRAVFDFEVDIGTEDALMRTPDDFVGKWIGISNANDKLHRVKTAQQEGEPEAMHLRVTTDCGRTSIEGWFPAEPPTLENFCKVCRMAAEKEQFGA